MVNIGTRIRYIREELGEKKLSMAAFAERLGVSSGAVSQWENNQRVPSNAVIRSISKEFNVNEAWIRTGEGNITATHTRESEIADVIAKMIKEDNPKRFELQKLFSELNEDGIELLYQTAKKWIEAIEKDQL